LFILGIELFESLSPAFMEAGRFMRAEQAPVAAALDPLHKEIGYPEGVEKVAGPNFILAVVLAQIEELEYIRMPGLEIDRKSALAFTTALIHITRRIVVNAQHGDDTVAGAIGAAYIGTGGPDIMDGQTDAAGALGDLGGLFERVIDAIDAVILHGKKEAGTHLRF